MFTLKYLKSFHFKHPVYEPTPRTPLEATENSFTRFFELDNCFELAERYVQKFSPKEKVLAAAWLLDSSPNYHAAKQIHGGNLKSIANVGQYRRLTKLLGAEEELLPKRRTDPREFTYSYIDKLKIKRKELETVVSGQYCEGYHVGYRGEDGDWKPTEPMKTKFQYVIPTKE